MRTIFAELIWAQRHARALSEAHASVLRGESWGLFAYSQYMMSLEKTAKQHAMIVDGLGRASGIFAPIRVQTMMAHYRDDEAGTRLEPWMFATGGVRVELVAWFCTRFRRPVAFWGDRSSVHALTPDGDWTRSAWGASARSLGPFRPAAIAHAIHESSSTGSAFLGFDRPVPTFCEALFRATFG